jgi:ribosome-binding ATPase YchF (GTP1/OBG family)
MDAVRDIHIIKNELIQKDIEIVSRKINEMSKKASKTTDPNLKK